MTDIFSVQEREALELEARGQFDWAAGDQETHPEGLAFYVGRKVVGGHTRNVVYKTAVSEALEAHLGGHFCLAAQTGAPVKIDRAVVVTSMRRDGTPRQPSSQLQRDLKLLKKSPETPLQVLVIGVQPSEPLTLSL